MADHLEVEQAQMRALVDQLLRYSALLADAVTATPERASLPTQKATVPPAPPARQNASARARATQGAVSHPASTLVDALVCPRCRSAAEVRASVVTADGRIKTGTIACTGAHGLVGLIDHGKLDFRPDPMALARAAAEPPGDPMVVEAIGERRVAADAHEVLREGEWLAAGNGMLVAGQPLGAGLRLRAPCTDASVRLLRRPSGGIADVYLDGHLVSSVDLSQEEGSQVLAVPVAVDLPLAVHEIAVWARVPAGRHEERIAVEEFVLWGPLNSGFAAPAPLNRGNPYSPNIERWLDRLPAGAPILEVGGGDRRRCRPGLFNLEFLKFELADGYGDVACLPFADHTFEAVCSQAVFEHLANPFAAAAELVRVTRPGGLVITEVAFMQPLHAVPFHYFNMTTWGVQELFSSCETVECGWFGALSSTVEWLLTSAGLATKVGPEELADLVQRVRALDPLVDYDDLRSVASGVYLVSRTPN